MTEPSDDDMNTVLRRRQQTNRLADRLRAGWGIPDDEPNPDHPEPPAAA